MGARCHELFKENGSQTRHGEAASFNKARLKKIETQENTLPTKETTQQKRREIS